MSLAASPIALVRLSVAEPWWRMAIGVLGWYPRRRSSRALSKSGWVEVVRWVPPSRWAWNLP